MLVRLEGEIDIGNAKELSTTLAEAASTGERMEVDMSAVTFIDSTGLHALLGVALSLDGSAPMIVIDAPTQVLRVMHIVGMDSLPQIEFRETR